MSDFWDRVANCDHDNISNTYNPVVSCDTPYCTAHEYHCLDCSAYIGECRCGAQRGISGWPASRWRKQE